LNLFPKNRFPLFRIVSGVTLDGFLDSQASPSMPPLTPREQQVMQQLMSGATNKEIAHA
jgi:DNA-binding CsgD family transcriptional regulator